MIYKFRILKHTDNPHANYIWAVEFCSCYDTWDYMIELGTWWSII